MTIRKICGVLAALIAAVSSANAQEVILSCDTSLRWGFIGPASEAGLIILEGSTRTAQEVDTSKLIDYGPQDTHGNVRRLKSRKTIKKCGPFVVEFSAGWFNSNPLGEMGEPQFAVFEVLKDGKRILGPIAVGACSSTGLAWGRCPEHWATSLTMGWDEKNTKGYFELHRTYAERINWP